MASGRRDPTERRALNGEVYEILQELLAAMPEHHGSIFAMYHGLIDGEPRTMTEVAQLHGKTRERVRQIISKVESRLRRPSQSTRLAGFIEDGSFSFLPAIIRSELLGYPVPPQTALVQCERHGWFDPSKIAKGRRTCAACSCPVKESSRRLGRTPTNRFSGAGRLPKYCSPACKQAAYRARRKEAEDGQ